MTYFHCVCNSSMSAMSVFHKLKRQAFQNKTFTVLFFLAGASSSVYLHVMSLSFVHHPFHAPCVCVSSCVYFSLCVVQSQKEDLIGTVLTGKVIPAYSFHSFHRNLTHS